MGIDNYRIMKYKTKVDLKTNKLSQKQSQVTSEIDTRDKQKAILILRSAPSIMFK